MTPTKTLQVLKKAGKPIVRSHFYRLVTLLGIKPLGHSRPANYPADTAERIKAHLGILTKGGTYADAPTRKETTGSRGVLSSKRKITRAELEQFMADGEKQFQAKHADKMISVRTLRAARPNKQTKGK